MMIQIVEPRDLIGRIVTERRPLAFPKPTARCESPEEQRLAVVLLVCLILVVSFGGLIACVLELVLESV